MSAKDTDERTPEEAERLMNAGLNSPLIKWLFPALTPR